MTFIGLLGEDLFRGLPIRGVMAGSETFPVGEQVRFEQEFGLQVAHWYGHSEYAVLAYCCRQCGGFHFYPTYGQVELLDSDTEGGQRIVASSFNRIGTQFVRYDTGDLAAPPTGTCAANAFPRADAIMGRSQETFRDGTGRRRALGPYVFGIHGSFWDQVRDLQIVQDRPGLLGVRLVTDPGADRDLIQQTLERRMPMVKLEFEYVPVIERSPSGKRRYFVNGWPAVAAEAPPGQPNGKAPAEGARTAPGWRWAVAAVALAATVIFMSFLVTALGADHHTTIRAHHFHAPVVNFHATVVDVKAPGHRGVAMFASADGARGPA